MMQVKKLSMNLAQTSCAEAIHFLKYCTLKQSRTRKGEDPEEARKNEKREGICVHEGRVESARHHYSCETHHYLVPYE